MKAKKGLEQMVKKLYKAVVVNDMHAPFHDSQAINASLKACRIVKPDEIIIAGDLVDFYLLSKFDKNPARKHTLQDELDEGMKILERYRRACPKAKITYLEGNHEARLQKYVWRHPELYNIRNLKMNSLMELDRLGIKYVPNNKYYKIKNGLVVTHGDMVRKHSGYTAKGFLENLGVSVLFGHTHRGGTHHKTDLSGSRTAYENFCLCDLNPEYVNNPNWQQGFSVVTVTDKDFFVEQVQIKKNGFVYGGKHYKK